MDAGVALRETVYAPPALAYGGDLDETENVVWWIVVVGLAYAVAIAYAAWCRHSGGDADISFGWSGFKVVCKSPS